MTFGIDNLPYGSVVGADGRRMAAVRLGDAALDLSRIDADLFADGALDAFLAGGPSTWTRIRAEAVAALTEDRHPLVPLADVRPVLSFTVADYVDFYASEHHARNAGRILRPDTPPLPRAWKHLPIGYHGRSGSLVVSGTEVRRPSGIVAADVVLPTGKLDFEAELAFVVGVPGACIPVDAADEHVFGVCLLNDWSARDIQSFESKPLGPFLGKSFATSVAAWITPLDALTAAVVPARQDPPPVAHLREGTPHGLALDLEIRVNDAVVSRPSFADMYWSYAQMLAHLTSNGSAVRTGDVFASGTVSGPQPDQRGCLLELTDNGAHPIDVGGRPSTWLEDGDEVRIRATAGDLDLADVAGRVMPA